MADLNNQPPEPKASWLWLAHAALFAGAYLACAELGHWLTIGPTPIATFWPPAGLYLAVLLHTETRRWPIFLLAALVGNGASDILLHDKTLPVALGLWLANSLGATISALLIRYAFGTPFTLSRLQDVLGFVLFAAIAVPPLSATVGAAVVATAFDDLAFWTVWLVWWAGDVVGVLVVAPLALQLLQAQPGAWLLSVKPLRVAEALVMLMVVFGVSGLVFGQTRSLPIGYAAGFVLLWPALRFGVQGVGWAGAVMAVVVLRNTAAGWGPFGADVLPAWGQVVLAQTFVAISTLSALVLATAELDRQRVMDALKATNVKLEGEVVRRTEDLRRNNEALRASQAQLQELNTNLERRVDERTRALRERELRYGAIFHSQSQFIGLMSPTGVLLEANRAALAAVGVSEESVIGKPFWETPWWTHDPSQQQRLREAVARAAAGEQVRFEASHSTHDETLMWVDFSLTPVRDETGTVVLLIPEGRNITERKRTEEALRESEERFRSAFDHAPIGLALVAPDGKWLRVNRSLCGIVGYSEAELLAIDFQTITHPDDLETDLGYVQEMLAGTIRTYQMEKRYFHKDGHVVYILLSVSLVRDATGEPLYFISQIKDISQRKQNERQLQAQDALLRQFIKHSPAAIAMFDRDMRYLQTSDRWLTDYGLSGRNIIGLSHYEVFPDLPDRWKTVHQRVLAGHVEICDEDLFHRVDGSTTWLQWECRPWHTAEGQVGGIIMFTQDITERKLAEERIKASLREKEVLLKEIHHRVKNNLQIVSTLLDLQSDYTQDRQALAMFQESRGRVKSMALIHERLYRSQDLARVNFTEYVRQLADDLYRAYKVSSDEIALDVEVDVPPLPIDIAIPCGLLLNELMSNCLKHSFKDAKEGRIQISLYRDNGTTILTVADDGVGFPDDVDFRNTKSFGMQLVNTLVEQLNGEIELVTNGGTAITVTFPDNRPTVPGTFS